MRALLAILRAPSRWLDRRIDARIEARENAAIGKLIDAANGLADTARSAIDRQNASLEDAAQACRKLDAAQSFGRVIHREAARQQGLGAARGSLGSAQHGRSDDAGSPRGDGDPR